MSQTYLLRGAKQLLTLRGVPDVRRGAASSDLAIIPDGSILISNGRIVSVGPTRRLENLAEARKAIEVPVYGFVVMPGFVDPGIQLSLVSPAKNNLPPKRKKLATFYQDSVALMRSCLQHGTLTAGVGATAGTGLAGSDMAMLRQLARIGDDPVSMVRAWPVAPLPGMNEALVAIRRHKLAAMLDVSGDVAEEVEGALLAAASKAALPYRTHWRGGDAARLERLLRSTESSGVFCNSTLSEAEQRVMVEAGVTAIFKAGGHLLESQPGGSLSEVVESGGAVALSSGYDAMEEMNFNMQFVVALAVMRLRLTVEQAIVAATINPAYAMHRGDEVGSLEVGKRAEILVLNLDDYRELPRRLGTNHVGMVFRRGHLVMNRTRWRVGAA